MRFYANSTLLKEQTGNGPYFHDVDMGGDFPGALGNNANRVKVVATNGSGFASDPAYQSVNVIPLPAAIKAITGLGRSSPSPPITVYADINQAGLDFDFPYPPIAAKLDLPVLGKFGFDFAANGSFDYTFNDGGWEAAIGAGAEGRQGKRGRRPDVPGLTRHPRLKLYLGNKEISGGIAAGATGTATLATGIRFDTVFGTANIGGKFELGRFGVLDLLWPGLSTSLGAIPGLGNVLKNVSVIIYASPSIDGRVNFGLDPRFAFKNAELKGSVAVDMAYEPDLGIAKMNLYAGGEPSVTLQHPGDLLKEVRFRLYTGVEFTAWIIRLGPYEYVFVDVSHPSATRGEEGLETELRTVVLRGRNQGGPAPFGRDYLVAGPERFVAQDGGGRGDGDALADFRELGDGPVAGQLAGAGRGEVAPRRDADLPLVENCFPLAQPALAADGQHLMLLYVADNGSPEDMQFTDIRWSFFDGSAWSAPEPVATDTRAEFSPQVCYDGAGTAIAVWERVKSPAFTQVDVAAMAAEMEIVWARYEAGGSWTVPEALTDNDHLDHAPLLAGPMADGSLVLVYTANAQNLLMGGPGEAASQVLWRRWQPGTGQWTPPAVLVESLPGRLSQSLAAAGAKAVYAWTRDMDDNPGTTADQELFHCSFADGAWSPPAQYAADSIQDATVRLAIVPDGAAFAVWQRGNDLVFDADFPSVPAIARENSQTAGFMDFCLTRSPFGTLALIWQEMSAEGPDAHYAVFDPASGRWSREAQFFADESLERSFAPAWDAVGNLAMAYCKVDVARGPKTVELEGGGQIVVDNVPQPGRVDMAVLKRRLVYDLALLPGSFEAPADNYLPGAEVRLRAHVRNAGDAALDTVRGAFYDGDPGAGGVEIGAVEHDGWLDAGDGWTAELVWVVPEPAGRHLLVAVVDADGQVSEFDETNNRRELAVGGTDLSLALISRTEYPDGSLRAIARLVNLGAPASTPVQLDLLLPDPGRGTAASVVVPAIEPGCSVEVAIGLPPEGLPEGEVEVTLVVDAANASEDADRSDNTVKFQALGWRNRPLAPSAAGVAAQGSPASLSPGMDYDGTPLAYLPAGLPAHGAVAGGDTLVYTPAPGFFGLDSFAYTAVAGEQSSAEGTLALAVNGAFTLQVAGGEPASVSFGMDAAATELFDDGLDEPTPAPGEGRGGGRVYFAVPGQGVETVALRRDLRPMSLDAEWRLEAQAGPDEGTTVESRQ